MARLTGRDDFVLVGVAGGTTLLLMFEGTGGQVVNSLFMAGAAIGILDLVIFVRHGCRHMRLVTFFAIDGNHLGGMGLVALGASRNLAVRVVTGAAEEFTVFARGFFELFDLLFVAGQTRRGHILAIGDDFGGASISAGG